MVVFLAPYHVDEPTATTLGLLWFAVGMAVSLMGGLVYMFGAYPKADMAPAVNEGTNDDGSIDRNTDQGRESELKTAA